MCGIADHLFPAFFMIADRRIDIMNYFVSEGYYELVIHQEPYKRL